ncbi:hypothetical protein E5288_WYG006165 [Bos mutus]|uniref:Uncharacterized protein n=1 Tax=Bos mutus TaxID=72004 RepID=A0A6B0QTD1_9CETA|nr:hypothetical protein [Bos mutus]
MAAFFTRKPDCGETKSTPSSRGPGFLPYEAPNIYGRLSDIKINAKNRRKWKNKMHNKMTESMRDPKVP